MEHAGGKRPGDGGGEDGRQPDPGVLHDVAHLQHGGAQPLTHQTAPAVFPEAHHGKAHHIGTASGHGGAACKAGQADGGADGGRGDGQRQGDADDHGDQNAHPERLEHRGPLDEVAHGTGGGTDSRCPPGRESHAHQDGHQGRHQDVDLGLLADGLAQLRGDDGNEQDRQRAACAAASGEGGGPQGVGGIAHRYQGEEHHGRRLEGVADGHGHGRAGHGGGVAAYGYEERDPQLIPQGVQNRADEQRAKKSLGHGAQGVDAIPLAGDDDVFTFQKSFEIFHGKHLFLSQK